MMSEWFLESANHTCGSYDRGVDELLLANLTPIPSVRVRTSLAASQALLCMWQMRLLGFEVPGPCAGQAAARAAVGSAL